MKAIINPWHNPDNIWSQPFYVVDERSEKYSFGHFKVYQIGLNAYLHTWKGHAISELAGINRTLLLHLSNRRRPEDNQQAFLYDRALARMEEALELI